MIKPVKRLMDRVRSSHSVPLERGKTESKADTGCVSCSSSLPFPFPFPPPSTLPRSYSLSQECFNFRDRFSLSNQAGWPVVQTMRCDGCKTIKKEWEMGQNKGEKSALYWTDLITLNRD